MVRKGLHTAMAVIVRKKFIKMQRNIQRKCLPLKRMKALKEWSEIFPRNPTISIHCNDFDRHWDTQVKCM